MQNLNKKAMSQIVTTVLIVGLTMVAIGIVATVVFKIINEETANLSPDEICFKSEIKIKSACYNSENQETEVTLERAFPKKQINEINFDLISKAKTESYYCSLNCGDCSILDSGTKKYYIFSEKSDSVNLNAGNCLETYVVSGC